MTRSPAARRGVAGPALAVALAGLLLGGCGVSTHPADVGTSTLEKKVSDVLTAKVGQRPDKISCPKPLPARKGATVRCTLSAGNDRLGVTVTTTKVQDGKVDFHVAVDEVPTTN